MAHLFMKLDEEMSLLGQAHALQRVKALKGVLNVAAHGSGYKVDLEKAGYTLSVTKQARDVNCVDYVGPCRRLSLID